MPYTIKKLADLAGVSTRTLRYYDEIGLLKPSRLSETGYRLYDQQEVDLLQQILFYKELAFPLEEIRKIVGEADFDLDVALGIHYKSLLKEKQRMEQLIATVENTIAMRKGAYTMKDREKFEGFKRELVATNESQYGEEIRHKYGEEAVDSSNAKLLGLSEEAFNKMGEVESRLFSLLKEVTAKKGTEVANNPTIDEEVYLLHKEWLMFTWAKYTKEAHRGLVEMYVLDSRFTAYYDEKVSVGATIVLKDIVTKYTL